MLLILICKHWQFSYKTKTIRLMLFNRFQTADPSIGASQWFLQSPIVGHLKCLSHYEIQLFIFTECSPTVHIISASKTSLFTSQIHLKKICTKSQVDSITLEKNTTNQNWERKTHLEDFNSRHNKIKELGKKKE